MSKRSKDNANMNIMPNISYISMPNKNETVS